MTPGDPPPTVTAAAEATLVAHQRLDITGCLCGWSELGKSHACHQVQMLTDAGVLAATPPDTNEEGQPA